MPAESLSAARISHGHVFENALVATEHGIHRYARFITGRDPHSLGHAHRDPETGRPAYRVPQRQKHEHPMPVPMTTAAPDPR